MNYLRKEMLLIFLVVSATAHAQDSSCVQRIKNKPGVILKTTKYTTAAGKQVQNSFLDAAYAQSLGRYKPKSIAIEPYYTYFDDPGLPANAYEFSCYVKRFLCKGDSIRVGYDKVGSYSIGFNLLPPLLQSSTEINDGVGFLALPNGEPLPKEIKPGIWERSIPYREEVSKEWLITYDGKLPFLFVTRKEFLQKQLTILNRKRDDASVQYKESLSRLETEKKQKEEEFKNDQARLAKYLKMDYDPFLETAKRNYTKTNEQIDQALANIKQKLQGSEVELAKPAIVLSGQKNDYEYELSDKGGEPFSKVLIKPNPSYYNKSVSKNVPQVIYVALKYLADYPAEKTFGQEMEALTNFDYLRSCIGKTSAPPVPASTSAH